MHVKSKILGLALGVLLALALLGVIGVMVAGVMTMGWNVVGVAMLSIAVPITFMTALKAVGLLYLVMILVNVVRTAIQAYTQKMQMRMAMKMMGDLNKQFAEGQKDDSPPDIMRHFGGFGRI